MNIVDYIFLAAAFIMIIAGIARGFIQSIIGFISTIVSYIAAFLLSGPIAQALAPLPFFDSYKEKIRSYFIENSSGAGETIADSIRKLNFPDFITKVIMDRMPDSTALLKAAATELADRIFLLLLTAIVFIVILAIVGISFLIVERVLSGVLKKWKVLDSINRILGAVLGAASALITTYMFLALLAVLSNQFPQLSENVADSRILSVMYNNNLLLMFFERFGLGMKN